MGNRLALVALCLTAIICGCRTDTTEIRKHPINPNGDSELALLMRDMFEESDSLKQLVKEGKQLSGLRKFEDIHSAIPTDSDASGPVFEAFAESYVNSIKALETSDSSTVFNFNNMVTQCMNCHTEFCPGPKKRIKQLYLKN
ncbi:MAG: hypothetical protein ACPGD8_08880 [Flavobacteriales bacterium]